MKAHLHRYGGRVMCGRLIDDLHHLAICTDAEWARASTFAGSQCKRCLRSAAADDEELMRLEAE